MKNTPQNKDNDRPLVISDPNEDIFYCQYCRRRLIPLPKGLYECPQCVIRFNPDNDRMRRATMITTIEGDIPVSAEPKQIAVTSTPQPKNPFDRQPPEIRGGLAELKKKGIKITSYHTTEKT